MIFAIPGAAQAATLAATEQSPEDGLVLTGLGVAMSAVGWLAAMAPRFTRKAPSPADDVARTARYVRLAPGVFIGVVAAMLLIVVIFMTLTPRGTSPDVLPIMAFLAAFPLPVGAGMLYSRHLHLNRDRLYSAWLERR